MSEKADIERKRGRPRSTPENEELEVILIPVIESDEAFQRRQDEVQEMLKT